MLDFLKEILSSPTGSFGFVAGILGLIAFMSYKTGGISEKLKTVNKLGENIDKMKDDLSEIKAFMRVLRQDKSDLVKAQSPISLTEKGRKVAKDLNAEQALKKQWEKLKKQIEAKLEKEHNPYDIQELCFKIGRGYSQILSEEEFDQVRRYAFKNGNNLSDYDLLYGVIIRDLYFEEKGLTIEDIND